MSVAKQKVNIMVALWRMLKLLAHFILGVITFFLFIKNYDESQKNRAFQAWSKKLIQLLAIDIQQHGELPNNPLNNVLIVSNHISWLDILVLFTVVKPKFVAKKEIESWPILGRLIKAGGTIFIDRESKRHLMHVNQQLSDVLLAGGCIAVFPEGTTSDGEKVLPFKASLFEPIYQTKGYVLPISLQYKDAMGQMTKRPAFTEEVSLLRSVWNVLTNYQLTAIVSFNDLLNSKNYKNRNQLAEAAREVIVTNVESELRT